MNTTYQKLVENLLQQGFDRVERDDRLLDVFRSETRVKGIELWEKWQNEDVHVVRIHKQTDPLDIQHFTIPRPVLEKALNNNQKLFLSDLEISN